MNYIIQIEFPPQIGLSRAMVDALGVLMHHGAVFSRPYAALTFVFGAFATIGQVVLLRECMVVLAGNELSIALALAAWLIGVSGGAVVGGWWSDRKTPTSTPIAIASVLLTLTIPVAVLLLRAGRELIGAQPGLLVSPVAAGLLCMTSLTPSSFGVGLAFAPLVRAGRNSIGLTSASSLVYAIEGAGAFLGGLLFTFVIAGRVSSLVLLGFAGAVLTCASAIVLFSSKRWVAAGLNGFLSCLCIVGVASGELANLDERSLAERWRSSAGVGSLVARIETPYQHLDLAEREGQFDLYSNGAPSLSFPDPYERVTPIHVAMTQGSRPPRKVLFVGGGVADRLAAALEHEPGTIDYVSPDPGDIQIVAPHLPTRDHEVLRDDRVRIIEEDGRRFVLEAARGRYDLIIVETPDPTTALTNRFYTKEFMTACSRALSDNGVVAMKIGTSVDYRHADVGAPAAVVYHTMAEVFETVAIWPGSTMRMFASSAPDIVSDDPEVLAERWRRRGIDSSTFSEHRFESLFRGREVEEARVRLSAMTPLPNRDSHPVAYLYGLVLWDQRARGADSPSPLWSLSKVSLWWLVVPLILLVVARALWRRRSKRTFDGLWSTFSGGFTGLSLEVMLLFIFQNTAGSLYAAVGVLVALFMIGLSSGTLISERRCRRLDALSLRRWAAIVDVATLCVVLTSPLLASTGSAASWLAGIWLFSAGLCTGAVFPPAVASLRATFPKSKGGRPAGIADAADHIGAFFGAIALGVVILPIGGLWGAALILALLKATSVVGWLSR